MSQATAKVLEFPADRVRNPDVFGRVRGDGRAIAVAKFRELADRLESGELDGARVQWRDDHGEESEMQTVTRTAETATGAGTVQLITTTIEEV